MEEEYIDYSNAQHNYEVAVARLKNDGSVSERNKQIICSFLRDAALGKTIIGRAKKRIGPSRLLGYINHLYLLINFLEKDLDAITQEDMEAFIEALEANHVHSRSRRRVGTSSVPTNAVLSQRYKVDVRVSIKKFYKWLWGRNREYPEIVEWIETYRPQKEIAALTELEIERMVDRCRTPFQRALIQVFFDGGVRVGELLNIRLRHVRKAHRDGQGNLGDYYSIRIPFSKTLPRTVALPMPATTKWLELWLEDHPAEPVTRQDGSLEARESAMQLFPTNPNAIRQMLRRVGKLTLGKRVYPHLLRHSSATYWCNKLPYFMLCKRFGWTMTSKMPQRYIDREGVDELKVVELYSQQRGRPVHQTGPWGVQDIIK